MIFYRKQYLQFSLLLLTSFSYSKNLKVKPTIFALQSSGGSDWVYDKTPITSFGAGIIIKYNDPLWSIFMNYQQLGFLGNISQNLYSFSSQKSLPYLDESKDADGYWSEYIQTKVTCKLKRTQIHIGIYDRNWGHGINSIHFSKKSPSFPQVGFSWDIYNNLRFIYFHGFLKSGVIDSSKSILYNNLIGQRQINVSRNIASHRIEWSPTNNFSLGINESVIYATRSLDIHYLIPISLFYPIENYLGDIDNIQMGFDLSYLFINKSKLYFGFFMDELTPEWIFNSKNHNWFAYQIGYSLKNFIFPNSTFTVEYNWTDQRIYKHKFKINDFYNHGEPLGFWAGPHAEELLALYSIKLKSYKVSIYYTSVKRGYVNNTIVETHYNDTHNKRYSDGYESKTYLSAKCEKTSAIKGLNYISNINWTEFESLGMQSSFSDIGKLSFELGIYYNFRSTNF